MKILREGFDDGLEDILGPGAVADDRTLYWRDADIQEIVFVVGRNAFDMALRLEVR